MRACPSALGCTPSTSRAPLSFITLLRSITLDLVLLAICRMSGMISFSMHSLLIPPSLASWEGMGSRQYTFNLGFCLRNSVMISL